MYNITFQNIVTYLTPKFLRKTNTLNLFFALIKPLQTLNTTLTIVWRAWVLKLVTFDGRVIMLEKLLNDEYSLTYNPNTRDYDISNADIIYIENTASNNLFYVFNKAEGRPPVYLYNYWTVGASFTTDEYCVYDGFVYMSLISPNIGNQPDASPAEWQKIGQTQYLFNKSEGNLYTVFIVWIPTSLGGTYETAGTNDNLRLKKLIDTFRLASKSNYDIRRY